MIKVITNNKRGQTHQAVSLISAGTISSARAIAGQSRDMRTPNSDILVHHANLLGSMYNFLSGVRNLFLPVFKSDIPVESGYQCGS
jgi:hypothetical protein